MEEYGHLQEKFEELNGYSYPSQIRGVLTGLGFSEADYSKSIANLVVVKKPVLLWQNFF